MPDGLPDANPKGTCVSSWKQTSDLFVPSECVNHHFKISLSPDYQGDNLGQQTIEGHIGKMPTSNIN